MHYYITTQLKLHQEEDDPPGILLTRLRVCVRL